MGFGKNLGNGHLNYFGHSIYSEIFTEIIKSYMKKMNNKFDILFIIGDLNLGGTEKHLLNVLPN